MLISIPIPSGIGIGIVTSLTYGSSAFLLANVNIWKQMQIIQDKALRAALRFPVYTVIKYIHDISNIPPIKTCVTARLQKSISRARNFGDKIQEENLLYILTKFETNGFLQSNSLC